MSRAIPDILMLLRIPLVDESADSFVTLHSGRLLLNHGPEVMGDLYSLGRTLESDSLLKVGLLMSGVNRFINGVSVNLIHQVIADAKVASPSMLMLCGFASLDGVAGTIVRDRTYCDCLVQIAESVLGHSWPILQSGSPPRGRLSMFASSLTRLFVKPQYRGIPVVDLPPPTLLMRQVPRMIDEAISTIEWVRLIENAREECNKEGIVIDQSRLLEALDDHSNGLSHAGYNHFCIDDLVDQLSLWAYDTKARSRHSGRVSVTVPLWNHIGYGSKWFYTLWDVDNANCWKFLGISQPVSDN